MARGKIRCSKNKTEALNPGFKDSDGKSARPSTAWSQSRRQLLSLREILESKLQLEDGNIYFRIYYTIIHDNMLQYKRMYYTVLGYFAVVAGFVAIVR